MEYWNIYDGGVISDHFLMLCLKKKYCWKFSEYEQKRSGILEEEATEKGVNIPLDKICKIISDGYPNIVFENLGSQLDLDFFWYRLMPLKVQDIYQPRQSSKSFNAQSSTSWNDIFTGGETIW